MKTSSRRSLSRAGACLPARRNLRQQRAAWRLTPQSSDRDAPANRQGLKASLQLLVESRVAVAEQHDQCPDAHGSSEGELEHAQDGSYDGYNPPPLRVM